jgi:hypothetical protein
VVDTLADVCELPAGNVRVELTSGSAERLAVGFLDLEMEYREIPADAWMVAGPFQAAGESLTSRDAVERCIRNMPFEPEHTLDYAKWRQGTGADDYVDFYLLTGGGKGCVYYAMSHIWSDSDRKARLSYGLDYCGRFWLNGAVIKEFTTGAGTPFKKQFCMDVTLRRGWNDLLIKVAPGSGGCGLWMAVSDSTGLKFAARKCD